MQYRLPRNYELVAEALKQAHREDLIGFGPHCLIRPAQARRDAEIAKAANGRRGQTASGKKAVAGKKKTIRNVHKKKGRERVRQGRKRHFLGLPRWESDVFCSVFDRKQKIWKKN